MYISRVWLLPFSVCVFGVQNIVLVVSGECCCCCVSMASKCVIAPAVAVAVSVKQQYGVGLCVQSFILCYLLWLPYATTVAASCMG